MTRKVEVVPHNPAWREAFEAESLRIAEILGENVAAIHHIGSTSIPTIYAKPIIDVLVAAVDLARVDDRNSAMEALGYEAMGEYGIRDRRYFRKDNRAGSRTHHVHIFEKGSGQIDRHLTFRDYMRTHPEDAQQYSELKQKLAAKYPEDIEGYMDGKHGFIQEIDSKAAAWRKQSVQGRSRIE
ncbi:GrpB family protein [Oscillatoriales cyanobacterium LEGE 11467]|uniref:GrpB family protein n=2 Tax=Zarconia TaxID=2992130 RepID=A0A928VYL2_9CYAN|nr:GrpB family protein [Zarconia navalis LEGE 11467]